MASDPQTWAELRASIAQWLNRDDLEDKIPEFIAFAERKFNRVLNVPERETSATLAALAETVAVPADLWAIRSVYPHSDPRKTLRQMSLSGLRDSYTSAATGRPLGYAVQGSNLVLGPIPASAYNLKVTYQQTIPALGESQPTNWLLAAHPDLYLYGALFEADTYLVNDQRLPLWKGRMEEILTEIRKVSEARRRGQSPLVKGFLAPGIRGILA